MANIEIKPLTPECWNDYEQLFLSNAVCTGCWCMWWRVNNKDFNSLGKNGLKEAMRTIVHQGVEAGLIAYVDGVPAGWVTMAPRVDYIRLKTTRALVPVDDQPVWSIPCFFVHHDYRHQGLMAQLIDAAEKYAKEHGAEIVEAYPFETDGKTSNSTIYTGVASVFKSAGYQEVARRKETRPIMRKMI